jgi:hypothetical protein
VRTQIPNKIYGLFEDLIKEYVQENHKFQSDPTAYIKNSDYILGGQISPSSREDHEVIEVQKSQGFRYFAQLHKNRKSMGLTREIAKLLSTSNQLKCRPSEIDDTVDRISFTFINDLVKQSPSIEEDKTKSILKGVIENKIANLRAGYTFYEFKFPIHVIGLAETLKLNNSLSIEKISDSKLSGKDLEQYMYSRAFEPNFFVHVSPKLKSTYRYAESNSVRAKEATINILKLLYGCDFGNSCWLSPIIKEKDNNPHVFSYFLSGERGHDFFDTRRYSTNYNIKEHKLFWEKIANSRTYQAKLHDLLFSIPELILSNRDVDKTVCNLVERSLRWYSDAINEEDRHVAIVKMTIALESLLNFKSDIYDGKEEGLKEIFVRRISLINQHDDETSIKADELYRARCSISHGEHLANNLSFDVKQFVANTILLCVQKFSRFEKQGLSEQEFSKALPRYIDSICATKQSTDSSIGTV